MGSLCNLSEGLLEQAHRLPIDMLQCIAREDSKLRISAEWQDRYRSSALQQETGVPSQAVEDELLAVAIARCGLLNSVLISTPATLQIIRVAMRLRVDTLRDEWLPMRSDLTCAPTVCVGDRVPPDLCVWSRGRRQPLDTWCAPGRRWCMLLLSGS